MYPNTNNSDAMWRAIIANANRAKGIEEAAPTYVAMPDGELPTPSLPGGGDNRPAIPGGELPTPTLPGGSIEQPGIPAVPGGHLPTPSVPSKPGVPIIPLPPIIQPLPLPPVCIGCPVFSDRRYCKVRFLHTIPGVGPVVVKFGDNVLASGLDYATFTDYVGVIGTYWSVSVYTDTTPQKLLFKQTMSFDPGTSLTLAIVSSGNKVDLLPIYQTGCLRNGRNLACLRFANLSASVGSVDFVTENYYTVASDVTYKSITPYRVSKENNYTFLVVPSNVAVPYTTDMETFDGGIIELDQVGYTSPPVEPLLKFNVNLFARVDYTICLLGGMGENAPLQVVVLEG